jgi:ABC-type transport system involved in multi-copper enzyme maturation permease subunit
MVGAVMHQELLLGSRRNRLYVFRWVYAGWLVAVVFYLFVQFADEEMRRHLSQFRAATNFNEVLPLPRASAPAVVGGRFAEAFVVQQLLLLLLATPAFVAGAVTDEKRRGTLPQLLTTDLDTRHILLGKLLGRTAEVLLLAVAGLPPFALLAGFARVGPWAILLLIAALAPPLFALASASVLASVFCRQTRDAVLALYALGTLAGLAVWHFGGPLDVLNPLSVLAPAWGTPALADLAEAGRRLAASALCWTALGGAFLGLAVWQLRPSCRREMEGARPAAASARWHSAPLVPVTDDPVRWRERYVEGLAPVPSLRRVRTGVGVAGIVAVTTCSSLVILALSLPPGVGPDAALRAFLSLSPAAIRAVMPDAALGFLVQSLVAMLLASLVVGVRCSGAVTGERERQTWEALLLTPLSARELIRGKLWGVMGASLWYLLAYAGPAVVFSAAGGLMALFWTVLFLAVTVLAMYYVGAAGLWCSVRARNSWRSLLGTLAAGYAGGIALYLVGSIPAALIAGILTAILTAVDRTYGTRTAMLLPGGLAAFETPFLVASSLCLALIFWLMSRAFLSNALRWVADRERTRHWHEEPVYRRSRRRAVPSRPAG